MLLLGVLLFIVPVFCTKQCPENCAGVASRTGPPCDSTSGACLEGCRGGFYGKDCSSPCDVNCINQSCHQRDGTCPCRVGYEQKKGICRVSEGTTCDMDYQHCKENICKLGGRGQCLFGCMEGWFGELCDRKCTNSCICHQESGACTECAAGWFGEKCESLCRDGCQGGNCDRNGSCIHGCKPEFHGVQCELKCSPHCESGSDQLTGDCVQCVAGRFGLTCESECSAGCAGTNTDCERDGRCTRGCSKGYYGERCEDNCPQECYDNLCDVTGACSACKNGFFGTLCQHSCDRCTAGVCDVKTGQCTTKGCKTSYYGSFCNLTCEDCKDGDCDADTECRHKDEREDTWSWVQSWLGGGVAVITVISIVAGLCYMSRRLKRMHSFIYDTITARWRRHPPTVCRPPVPHGYVEFDEEVTITSPSPRACPIRPARQTSYIRPTQSDDNLHEQPNNELQAAVALPSQRLLPDILPYSDESSDETEGYTLPQYCEVNEQLMATLPQPAQGAEAETPVVNNSSISVVAEVHAQLGDGGSGNATGDINIPLIADCFGPVEAKDSESDEVSRADDNYEHPFRDYL